MSEDNAVNAESEEREPGSTHSSAHELGDITAQRLQGGLQKLAQTVGTEGDGVDYYRFTLSEAREVRLGLKLRQGGAELSVEDVEGNVLARSMAYAGYEAAVRTLLPGTYYVRVEAVGTAASEYEFRYGVLEANASFRPASDSAWYAGLAEKMGMPSFGEAGYGFELSEAADGRVSGVLLGTVLAVDPNGEELSYRIVGGNGSGLFAIDGASGELSYVGGGEDYEGDTGPYEMTVRASDGTHTIDTTVTVTITDAAEAPAFGDASYAFALSENTGGGVNRLSLGTVLATDPDGDAVRYSLAGGNESGLFAIDETSGELFYVGSGEDFEGGVTSHELTVRASDGADSTDATVTVTVTDAAESPAFGDASYEFELAENANGSVNRISLGVVEATDPDGDAVRYSLVGGNASGLFAIDAASGELYYGGSGEDFEGGAGSYELTVRASDAAHTVDTAVTVTVTDAAEAPAFSEEDYAFALAENTDGSVARLSLGTVAATDPDGDAVRYSLAGGNELGLFAIDETSGELFYGGAGEDYEGGAGLYELTVRASDATHASDTTVTVALSDVRGHSEPEGGDLPQDRTTSGLGLVDEGAVTGDVEAPGDVDWFAVQLVAGRTYQIDVRGQPTGDGTLVDPHLHGVYDEDGGLIGGTTDFDSGTSHNSRLLFTAPGEGTHYIAASGGNGTQAYGTGTYELEVSDVRAPVFAESGYRFALSENVDGSVNRQSLGVVEATDPDGGSVRYSLVDGNGSRRFAIDADTGEVFYVGPGEDYESGVTSHDLKVQASDGSYSTEVTVTVTVTDVAEAPAFGEERYAFALAENTDGSDNRLSLGTVEATDPSGDAVHYSLAGGNESGLFAIDETSGEFYYVGVGEDYESGVTTYQLTVRARDETRTVDTMVTVTVVDAPEAPLFAEESYAFALAENTDGSDNRLSLGAVKATDPDGDAVRYSLSGGNESGLFAIDEASGELYYVGAGEDFESDAGPYELTVQASDGTHTVDAMVTVTVVDDPSDFEKSIEPQGSSEPAGEDLPAGRETSGEVRVDAEPVEGTLRSPSDRDWFAVTLAPGRTYAFNLEGDTPRGGIDAAPAIRGLRDANGDPVAGIVGGVEVRYATDAAAAEAVYYVEVGGGGDSGQGSSATRGFGTRSSVVDTRGNSDGGSDYRLWASDITETRDTTDDYRSGVMTTGVVTEGGSVMGEIERSGDRDWFAVELVEGRLYRIDLEGHWTKAGTLLNAYLRGVYDAIGNLIDGTPNDNSGVGFNSRGYFMAPEAGTYYVAAGGYGGSEGTYTLSVRDVTDGVPDDFAAGTGTSGRVEVGGKATGKIEYAGDRDWFAVTLDAGRLYQIDLEGLDTGAGTLRDPYLRGVHDADGNRIDGTRNNDSGAGLNSRGYFKAEEPGTYYAAAGTRENEVGTYTLSVTDVTDDFASGTWTSGTVEVGGTATGEIEILRDTDWFAVILEAGKAYRIDLEGRDTGAGTLRDPYLRGVHGADGNRIDGTTNDNSGAGKNSRVFFTAPEADTYYVAAGSRNTYEVGTYTLSVTEVVDDFAADTDTTGTVTVGDTVTGEIDLPRDTDWFAVDLEAGKVYRIDLEGWDTRAGTLRDPYVRGVHDADGNLIDGTTDDNGGAGYNSRVFFAASAAADATYYVSAGDSGSSIGTYTLSVTEIVDDYASDTDTTGTVTVGGTATGEIKYPGDRDWFAVDLEAGKVYRIYLEGRDTRAGTLRDPYLFGVHDGDGDLIGDTTNDNGGGGHNSRVFFTAVEEGGTYYVSAGGSGSSIGTYTLSVIEGVDDYASDTDTTGTVMVGGTATGEIETSEDRDWFAVDLEAGKVYWIGLKGWDAGAGTLRNPYLRGIHDGDGDLIGGTTDDNSGSGHNSRVFFMAKEGGTYYVSAGGSGSSIGTYMLSVIEGVDDYASDTDTTGTVMVGGKAPGKIDYPRDTDWFAVELEAGKAYRIDLEGWRTRAGTLFDPYLRGVHDADGHLINGTTNDSRGAGANSRVYFRADADTTYYVSAGADGGTSGTYTLSVTEIVDDYTSGTDTTGTVMVGGKATGKIDYPYDRDWFEVTLEADTTYRIDLEGSRTGAGTLLVTYLAGVHDADGRLIGDTTNFAGGVGHNSRVLFEAAEPGAYYVAASAFDLWGGGYLGTYTLSVEEVTDGM